MPVHLQVIFNEDGTARISCSDPDRVRQVGFFRLAQRVVEDAMARPPSEGTSKTAGIEGGTTTGRGPRLEVRKLP